MLSEPASQPLVETVELNLRHLGLGDLDEFGLLTLFADVQAHWLLSGTDHTLRDIADADGAPLYPAYYRTHVRVPPSRLLHEHLLWSRVAVGVDVKSFGGMLLESRYVLAPEGEAPADPEGWDAALFPTMAASSMFIVDDLSRFPRASGPAEGAVREIDRVTTPPEAMAVFRKLRGGGSLETAEPSSATDSGAGPVSYPVEPHRDAAPGHNMMFAQYVRLMDHAEGAVLRRAAETLTPQVARELLGGLATLERETYYFGNCQAGETVFARLTGGFVPDAAELGAPSTSASFAGVLSWNMELFRDAEGEDRLAVSRCRKVLALPADRPDLVEAAEALISGPWRRLAAGLPGRTN